MDYRLLPEHPNDQLQIYMALREPYAAVKDAFDRAVERAFAGSRFTLAETKDEPGGRHFELRNESGYFFAAAKLFFDSSKTRVVLENRRPSDGHWGGAWKQAVVTLTHALCEQLSERGYATEAERAHLLMQLEPHSKS